MKSFFRILGSGTLVLLPILFWGSCNFFKKDTSGSSIGNDTAAAGKTDTMHAVKKGLYNVDTVFISDMKFHPEEIKMHKGDTVIWINNDLVAHCVTETKTKAWTSYQLAAGEVWKMPVLKSADYYCAIHLVMKGKIVVE